MLDIAQLDVWNHYPYADNSTLLPYTRRMQHHCRADDFAIPAKDQKMLELLTQAMLFQRGFDMKLDCSEHVTTLSCINDDCQAFVCLVCISRARLAKQHACSFHSCQIFRPRPNKEGVLKELVTVNDLF